MSTSPASRERKAQSRFLARLREKKAQSRFLARLRERWIARQRKTERDRNAPYERPPHAPSPLLDHHTLGRLHATRAETRNAPRPLPLRRVPPRQGLRRRPRQALLPAQPPKPCAILCWQNSGGLSALAEKPEGPASRSPPHHAGYAAGRS